MAKTVQEALEERKKRLSTSSNDKVSAALEARKKRLESEKESSLADIRDRIISEVDSYNEYISGVGDMTWGNADVGSTLADQRERTIALSMLKRDIEASRNYLGDTGYEELLENVDKLSEGYSGILNNAKLYSEFGSEDEYNVHQEKQKKAWEEYQAYLENLEAKKAFDTTAGQKEIEGLEALLKQAEEWENSRTRPTTNTTTGMPSATIEATPPPAGGASSTAKPYTTSTVKKEEEAATKKTEVAPPPSGSVNPINQNKYNSEMQNQYLIKSGYGSLEELREAVANKRVYLREAQEVQKITAMESVANPESETYDPEFSKWAAAGEAIENPQVGTVWGGADDDKVKNKVTYARDDYNTFKKGYDGESDTIHPAVFMTEDEVAVWNYHLAKDQAEGTENANAYYEALLPTLEARKAGNIADIKGDNVFKAITFNLSTGVESFFTNVANNWSDEDYIRPTVNQMAQSMIRQEYEEDGKWLATTAFDLASTTGNMLPSILIGAATGGIGSAVGGAVASALGASTTAAAAVGSTVGTIAQKLGFASSMGSSAMGAGYAEMLNLGYSKDQARAYGAMVGIAETATSYILGSIGGGGKGADGILSGITKNALSKVDNALARVAIQFGGTMGSEFIEEGLQTAIEPWLKSLATGVDFEAAGIDEILYSGLLGALSAGVLEGPGIVAGGVKTRNVGKTVQNVDGGVQKLQQIGNTFSADTVAYKLANKVDENTGAYTIGRLFQEVGATISEQNVADIVAGLEAKGVENDVATKIAKKYQAYVNGDTVFSQAGKEFLEKYTDLGNVLKNNIIRANLTENQRIEYRSEGTVGQRMEQRSKEYAELYALANEVANGKAQSKDTSQNAQKSPQSENGFDPNTITTKGKKLSTSEHGYDTTGFALLSKEEVRRRIAEDPGFGYAYYSWVEKANAKTLEKSVPNRTAAPKAESISTTGETVDSVTGKSVKINNDNAIDRVETVNGEKVVYYNTNNGVVSSKDIRYADRGDALVYEAFADMNTLYANEVIRSYDKNLLKQYNIDTKTFVDGMSMGIEVYGKYNFQEVGKDIATGTAFAALPKELQTIALNIGRRASKPYYTQKATKLKEAMAEAKEKVSDSKRKNGVVTFENGARAGKAHKSVVKLAEVIARATGVDIVFYDATIPGTREANANGWYDRDTRTIHLDLQKARDDAKTIAFTFAHELVHFVEDISPEKFKAFADFLFEQYSEHGVPTQELLERKMAELNENDIDKAYSELVADACERMLLDSNAVEKLALLNQKDAGLVQKIKTFISNLISKIKAEYAKYQPTSDEAKYLSKMEDVLGKFYEMFEDMLVDAAQTNQALPRLETESVSMSEDGTVQLQMKQYRETGRSTLLNYLTKTYGKDDANNLISTIDNIYDAMMEIRKDDALSVFSNWQETDIELDENGHPIFTTSINNGDYELNQDFSRVCKKRRQLDFVLNMLAEDPAFEASHLTKADFVKINKAIKDHGFEIACALCFVDSKRFRQAEWADSFANTWNDILNSVVTDKSKLTPFNFATKTPNLSDEGIEIDTTKSVMYRKWSDGAEDVKGRRNYKSLDELLSKEVGKDGKGKYVEGNANVRLIAELIRDNPNLRHTFRGADIIASQGFDTIQRLAPKIRGILDGWGGSSVPKPSSSDASYDSSIINNRGYNKETAYAMGGVRMNSFSDFMAHMFFDYCQAFADLSAKELPSQAYTKELTYVRLFGRSGQKINMSGIAAIREDALPTKEGKGLTKKQAEANLAIEKRIAGLDPSRLLEYLNKSIQDLTAEEIEQHLDMLDYVWADESIDMKNATLLQTGILYDKLSESKVEECYELLKAGEVEMALKAAGEANVDREYAKHCGTIVVGVSDAHIRKLLRDPTVRMVIPYHKSGLNPTIARELRIDAYNDYTNTQNTEVEKTGVILKGKTERKGIASTEMKDTFGLKDFAFYDWFGKTIDGKLYDGKATAEKYLEWCEKGYFYEEVGDYVYYTTKGEGYILASEFHKKAKIVPKFDAFSDEANYYKVLEDFDTYDTITGEHSAQGAVDFFRNGLPSDYKGVLTKALKDEQATSDAFRDHLDNKGLKDEIMDIVKKRGYQPSDGIKRQAKVKNSEAKTKPISIPGTDKTLSQAFVDQTLNSFGMDNLGDFEQAQERVYNTLLKEGFFTETNPISRKDTNYESGMVVETNKSGLDETFCFENYAVVGRFKKIVKLATIRELPNAIKYGKLIGDNVPNQYDKRKGTKYAYLVYDTNIDGVGVTIKTTIRKSAQKNKFWVHSLQATKNVSGAPADTNNGVKTGYKTADIGEIITQPSDSVKSQNQKKQLSNRSILANALESTVDTSTQQGRNELIMLKRYQENVGKVDELEAQLKEVKAEIYRLSFSKGAKDRARLTQLYDERTKLTNRINLVDKKLLDIEASKPLKDLLTREKEKARKLGVEKGRQSLVNYKEGRQKTEMRHKIKKVVGDLNTLLLNPTKDKHVPIGLQKPVAEALRLINMDTVGAEERLAYYDGLIAKANDPNIIAELKASRDRIETQGENLAEKLKLLKEEYSNIEQSEDPMVKNSHDPIIQGLIENTAEVVGNTSLRNMNYEQLDAVYRMFRAVLARIRTANKMFVEGKTTTVADNSNTVQLEVAAVGGKNLKELAALSGFKKFGWSLFKPVNAFNVIGSDRLGKLFENVRKGEDTWANDAEEAREYFLATARRHKYWSWDFKEQHSFKDRYGSEFSLSLPQIMSLYAYSRRKQADLHLAEGGFIFGDNVEVIEKKRGVPLKYKVNDATPYRLDEASLEKVISTLTDSQKFFVEEMQDYLSTVMGEKGNEVSLAMYDIKLFNEKYYFPLRTSQYYREFDPEKGGKPKIKNSSFAKSTVKGATAPIVLEDFTEVWAKHVQDMAMYHSFVLPLEDFTKVYNYHTVQGGYDSVMAKIKNAYGENAIQYIQQLLDDLNGGARSDPNAGFMNKLISKFKKGAVFASLSVVIQQPSAIGRAYAYINPKYFVGKHDYKSHKKNWEECKKYAPVAIIKEMGYFDTHVGMRTTDWITQREMSDYEGFKGKTKGIWENRDEYLSKLPALADEMTWSAIWNAVKRETADTTNLRPGTEEFLKKAGERFTEVITNTQVYDSVLSRPAIMRSKDTGVKMATAFMAEPLTSVNMMVNANKQSKRGYKKFARGIRASVATSVILNSLLVSLIYAARDDDEDETYAEKYLGSLVTELVDGFNPVTYIPFAKDFWSIAQGFDVERSDMSIVSDLWESVEELFDENKGAYDKVRDTVGTVSNLFGLPVKNVWRDVDAVFNTISGIIKGTPTTGAGVGEAVMDAVRNSIPLLGRFTPEATKAQKLYNAILSGDQAHIKRLEEGFSSQDAIDSAMKSALRENDPRIREAALAHMNGNVNERVRLKNAVASEGYFDEDIVESAISGEVSSFNSNIAKAVEAKSTGDTEEYNKVIKELADKGYSQAIISKKMEEKSEDIDDEDDDDKIESDYKASDIGIAYDNGYEDMALEVIEDLVRVKTENYIKEGEKKKDAEKKAKSSVRSTVTSYWKPIYLQAYKSKNSAEMRRIRYILKDTDLYDNVVETCQDWIKQSKK